MAAMVGIFMWAVNVRSDKNSLHYIYGLHDAKSTHLLMEESG